MFEVSKTAINMAEKRGFTVEQSDFGGNSYCVMNRAGKVSFNYMLLDESMKLVFADPQEAELTQGFPDEITSDAQLRDLLKNWPLSDGEESEDI